MRLNTSTFESDFFYCTQQHAITRFAHARSMRRPSKTFEPPSVLQTPFLTLLDDSTAPFRITMCRNLPAHCDKTTVLVTSLFCRQILRAYSPILIITTAPLRASLEQYCSSPRLRWSCVTFMTSQKQLKIKIKRETVHAISQQRWNVSNSIFSFISTSHHTTNITNCTKISPVDALHRLSWTTRLSHPLYPSSPKAS